MRLIPAPLVQLVAMQASLALAAWPSPEFIEGITPHNADNITMDPGLLRRADGKLFLYTTGNVTGKVWTADSLYGPWTLSNQSGLGEVGGAPQLYDFDGLYYMFHNSHLFNYAAEQGVTNPEATKHWHDASILVKTSTTMEPGTWQPHGRLNVTWSPNYNILDASFMSVNTSATQRQNLLSFGSYQDGLFQIPMADPPVELAADAMADLTPLAQNTSTTRNGFRDPIEASFQFQYGDYYYLFFSSGRCCIENDLTWAPRGDVYKIMVCRSQDPSKDYVDKDGKSCLKDNGGTEILGSHDEVWAPGGQGVMNDTETGGPMIYYHYVPFNTTTNQPDYGYRLGWNKLDFGNDGWPTLVAMATGKGTAAAGTASGDDNESGAVQQRPALYIYVLMAALAVVMRIPRYDLMNVI